MTRRLYYDDPYRTEFEARVVRRETVEGKPVLVLDQTYFYPESGGQPSDRGSINGVPLVRVAEDGEDVLHVLEKDVAGETVKASIDWPLRFDHMQQHSGQHILSQAFIEVLAGETRSFHLGEGVSALEIGLAKITDDEVARVELRANAVVFEDREVKTYLVPEDKISLVPLRRPPKKEGTIRVVEVAGFDYSACGGTHVRRTGEVGLIKVTGWEKIRGNLRFEFVCGGRALADYTEKNNGLRRISGMFSVSPMDAPGSVEKALAELKAQKKAARAMQERLARFEAQEFIRASGGRILRKVFADRSADEVRLLALSVIRQGSFVVLFAAQAEPQSHIVLARSDDIQFDLRELAPQIIAATGGKGGGSPSLVEIVTQDPSKIEAALGLSEERIRSVT